MEHPVRKVNRAHLERVRKICLSYPEAVEVEQFGSPWWKAGKKSFCIYGTDDDGNSGLSLNVSPEEQSLLIEDPRFTKSRYIGRHGWTSMSLAGRIDWSEVEELVDTAYRHVALRRMLKALDAR